MTAAILFLTYRYLLGSLSAEQFGLWALVAFVLGTKHQSLNARR